MTYLFNRRVELKVGKPGDLGKIFSDLRIEFEIEKTKESNANTGKIAIYNLNQASRDLLTQKGAKYEFKAGYFGFGETPLIGVLSSGDVTEVATERKGPDIVTSFKIGEAIKALGETKIEKSYGEGVSLKSVMGDLGNALGVAKSTIIGASNESLSSGYSASGKVKDRLDEITKKQGLDWSVQNDELIIIPKGKGKNVEAILLSAATGLMKVYKAKKEVEGTDVKIDTYVFECLLNPKICIAQAVRFESTISGININAIVQKVKYSGDNKDGKFMCQGEAI
jgi:hypothetical protein